MSVIGTEIGRMIDDITKADIQTRLDMWDIEIADDGTVIERFSGKTYRNVATFARQVIAEELNTPDL